MDEIRAQMNEIGFVTTFYKNPLQFFFFYSSFVTWRPNHHNFFGANSQIEAAKLCCSKISHTLPVDK